ncbi:hypothetical protein DF286_03265 [Sphingosinicella humi]|uniref:Uncharacterized protein n=1 Tax=Allosphingosinicella humi TaxID=2068657 RepID=A0A2U2J0Y1_9SPHN|nr:hypothetical protein DF286_03265 [Sphingosinicella humi]
MICQYVEDSVIGDIAQSLGRRRRPPRPIARSEACHRTVSTQLIQKAIKIALLHPEISGGLLSIPCSRCVDPKIAVDHR